MLDIVLFRVDQGGDPEIVRESQRRRYADVTLVDQVIEIDTALKAFSGFVQQQDSAVVAKKCEEYQKIVDQLKKAIASTFTKTGCPRTAAFADSAVTENNMLDYLAAIEERANAIISDYAEVKVRQREEAVKRCEPSLVMVMKRSESASASGALHLAVHVARRRAEEDSEEGTHHRSFRERR